MSKTFAAMIVMAVAVVAQEEEKENRMFNSAYDTLTNQMVNYEFNGYDWPLTCKTGKKQSPVDLHSGFASTNTALAIRAKGFEAISSGKVKRGPNNMSIDLPTGQFDIIDPMGQYTEYTPYEAVIKSPSEHTVNGLTYDSEIQFMFKKKGGASENEVAGISIFFDGTSGGRMTNAFMESLQFNNIPRQEETAAELQRGREWNVKNVDMPGLLESMAGSTYWSYEGSLTMPPCTEGVRWVVFEQVQSLTMAQAKAMRQHFNYNKQWQGYPNGNNRGTMPLNRRYIYYGGANALVAGATALAFAALF